MALGVNCLCPTLTSRGPTKTHPGCLKDKSKLEVGWIIHPQVPFPAHPSFGKAGILEWWSTCPWLGGWEGRKHRDLSAVLSSLADDPLVISTVSIQLLRAARADQGAPFLQLRAEEGRGQPGRWLGSWLMHEQCDR